MATNLYVICATKYTDTCEDEVELSTEIVPVLPQNLLFEAMERALGVVGMDYVRVFVVEESDEWLWHPEPFRLKQ